MAHLTNPSKFHTTFGIARMGNASDTNPFGFQLVLHNHALVRGIYEGLISVRKVETHKGMKSLKFTFPLNTNDAVPKIINYMYTMGEYVMDAMAMLFIT